MDKEVTSEETSTTDDKVNQGDQNQNNQPKPDDVAAQQVVEAQAKNLGWVPKDEFRGDPEQWRDAGEFVKHGEDTLPILRQNLKRMHTKLDDQGRVIKEFAEHHKKVEERAYQKALKKLKEERLVAVDKGDTQEFEKKDKEIADLEQDKPEAGDKKVADGFDEWSEDNNWYGTDIEMSIYADQVGGFLSANHKNWDSKRVFTEVAKEVKIKFPSKFKNARRSSPSPVESGGMPQDTAGTSGKKYSDLPPEAKKACAGFVKEGLMKQDDYVKEYFAE